jgi:hypothetical protein
MDRRRAQIRTRCVRKQKTDKCDAGHILKLLVEDRFPPIWVPERKCLISGSCSSIYSPSQAGTDTNAGEKRVDQSLLAREQAYRPAVAA